MIKRFFRNSLLAIVAVLFCFAFAGKTPFFMREQVRSMEDMSLQDIQITVIDDSTVRLENLIKGRGITYSWLISNTINGTKVHNDEMLAEAENDVIDISYEKLSDISFQAIIEYDGIQYKSKTFTVQNNGELNVFDENTAANTVITQSMGRGVEDIVSLAFSLFLLVTVLLYYIAPKQYQWVVLLLASIFFYILSGVQYLVFIVFSSLVAFLCARKMASAYIKQEKKFKHIKDAKLIKAYKKQMQKQNKLWLITAFFGTLSVMLIIKYTAFVAESVNVWLNLNIPLISFVMPLGLSFYTFVLLAYLIDVYRGKYLSENNFLKFFLFVSFFPHVSQGPISRFDDLSVQFRKKHVFSFENLCYAAQRILWGFFVKLVIADRLGLLVNGVYNNYEGQSRQMLILATIAYSVQIYADFYSSMEIAIGSAQLFGIKLSENFMRPYFSTTMPEFWRRWHITLGTWFRDYIFYPISVSKTLMKFNVWARKKWGTHASRVLASAPPIMIVWLLTGLWHGASWNFVAWGLFHGCLILLSTAFSSPYQKSLEKLGVPTKSFGYKLLQMSKVFLLCSIGRVFFRAESITAAFGIFKNIASLPSQNALIDDLAIYYSWVDAMVLFAGLLMFLAVGIMQERAYSVRLNISKLNILLRWSIWIVLIMGTVLFGIYGPGTSPVFLYEDF